MNMHSSILTEDILLDDNPDDILFIHEIAESMGEIAILEELISSILEEDTNNEQG